MLLKFLVTEIKILLVIFYLKKENPPFPLTRRAFLYCKKNVVFALNKIFVT